MLTPSMSALGAKSLPAQNIVNAVAHASLNALVCQTMAGQGSAGVRPSRPFHRPCTSALCVCWNWCGSSPHALSVQKGAPEPPVARDHWERAAKEALVSVGAPLAGDEGQLTQS